jgi:hypothetical protein
MRLTTSDQSKGNPVAQMIFLRLSTFVQIFKLARYILLSCACLSHSKNQIHHQALRVEVNNPDQSTRWRFLFEFGNDQHIACQELLDDLNIINAPVQLRIVPNTR